MKPRIVWAQGGAATFEAIEGDERVELTSERPFAPGARPEGTLEAGGQLVLIKVHGSKRLPDGAYRVLGRLVNVTKAVRALLKEGVSAGIGGKSPVS
jgi:hypothetical protein